MSYENSPSTHMLATHCAFCARPLRDAQSVEVGVGPICRRKYMVADQVTEASRVEGNKLIHTIAKLQRGPEVKQALARLAELGFAQVVKRIRKRLKEWRTKVTLSYEGGRLFLQTPSIGDDVWDQWLDGLRSIKGRKFEGKDMGNSFPMDQRGSVHNLLLNFFPGFPAEGPKGEFIIGA